MTFREKLADWLTGGGLSKARDSATYFQKLLYETEQDQVDTAISHKAVSIKYMDAVERLSAIASIPISQSSNGQTRKAVRIAKEALL